MTQIRRLPEHLVDQIKAGEVIDKPASLLKELIENAIDAHATKVDLHIVDNGMELIHIEDDGDGMSFEDLPNAFSRHATSKIERFEDIYHLGSYGFRGEALASISSIARVTCVTSVKEQDQGGKIVIHGGKKQSLTPYKNTGHGTSIFVKDLFYNTPVRMKFIKSKSSQKNFIKKVINYYILSNPQITFSVKWDDQEKEFYYATSSPVERISKVLLKKKNTDDQLIQIDGEYDQYKLYGFLTKHSSKSNTNRQTYLFINKRFFQDRAIHSTIVRSMQKLWAPSTAGNYCIMLDGPSTQVDVNVHPSKTWVKFSQASIIFSLISASIKKALGTKQFEVTASTAEHNTQLYDLDLTGAKPDFKAFDSEGAVAPYQVVGRVGGGYYLISVAGVVGSSSYVIVDLRGLINRYWQTIYQQFPLTDASVTPLLITTPYQVERGQIDIHFEFFGNIGFAFDRLDDSTIALRSIPSKLSNLPVREMVSQMLHFFKNHNSTNHGMDLFEDFLANVNSAGMFSDFSTNCLSKILLQIDPSDLYKSKIFLKLGEEEVIKLKNCL
ncbi:MAG: DNA mismatch repair endonuclease MutL [Bacteriovoracaceae bacterium]|nr:DNA mismatch repair endonuclease MutL [Bacteriovoracaceae bacterium]